MTQDLSDLKLEELERNTRSEALSSPGVGGGKGEEEEAQGCGTDRAVSFAAANHAHQLPAASAVSPPMVTHAEPIRYGSWLIYRNDFTAHPDWRSVAWLYAHEEYDGPEDNRHGFGATVEACITDIQERTA